MFIERLHLENILSFRESTIQLGPLNVLIGPNAVGKSNLIEAIGLLQAAPSSFAAGVLRAGGVRQLLWLGDGPSSVFATVESTFKLERWGETTFYKLVFAEDAGGLAITKERIANIEQPVEQIYLDRNGTEASGQNWKGAILAKTESYLSQYRDPSDKTPITELGDHLRQIRIYREFRTGAQSAARLGISTATTKQALSDGGENLALVLQDLDFLGRHEQVRHYLARFCERFADVKIGLDGGIARAYLREAGLTDMLSPVRMSDGTLKFLALLAALFHPTRAPLICIEEPELGLHPDALQLVAEVLQEASKTTQLIITTHSEALVDALSDTPESVLVCERDFNNSTQMKRLSGNALKKWLERYSLGQLWRKGEIGGVRW